jgi:hypothetical protein
MRDLPRFTRASVLFVSWFAVLASCESRFTSVFFLSLGLSSSQSGFVDIFCNLRYRWMIAHSRHCSCCAAIRSTTRGAIVECVYFSRFLRHGGEISFQVPMQTRVARGTYWCWYICRLWSNLKMGNLTGMQVCGSCGVATFMLYSIVHFGYITQSCKSRVSIIQEVAQLVLI